VPAQWLEDATPACAEERAGQRREDDHEATLRTVILAAVAVMAALAWPVGRA
jgi:hypothetical protein